MVLTVDARQLQAAPVQEPQAGQDLRRSRSASSGLETPAGLYHIQNKAVDPAWTCPHSAWAGSLAGQVIPGGAPNNPLKARWMGIFDGAGIHGTDPSEYGSIGTAASHGCVGMRIPDVEDLYDRGAGRRADLHRLSLVVARRAPRAVTARDLVDGTSCPAALEEQGMVGASGERPGVPMNMPFSRLRMTAYHMVVASLVPWIRCHGRGTSPPGDAMPAAISCCCVATCPR